MSDYDVLKFKSIQNLIGLSIDNTADQHSIINVRLGLYEKIDNIANLVEEH